jgi:hypothetical protein
VGQADGGGGCWHVGENSTAVNARGPCVIDAVTPRCKVKTEADAAEEKSGDAADEAASSG